MWQSQILIECFSSNWFDEWEQVLFLQILPNKNVSNFAEIMKFLTLWNSLDSTNLAKLICHATSGNSWLVDWFN